MSAISRTAGIGRWVFAPPLIYLIVIVLLLFGCSKEDRGAKTDSQRMEDVHRIAGVIEKYRQKTGRYPYAENWDNVAEGMVAIRIGVFISSQELPKEYRYPPGGRTGAILLYKDFITYLGKVLGKALRLPQDDLDPNAWVPYQFAFDGTNYFISAHLTGPNKFTRPVTGAHKYQVGSIGNASMKIRAYSEIRP